MGIIAFIILGGLAGWIASLIMGTDGQQGLFLNIIVGMLGAFIGGWIGSQMGFGDITGFNIKSFLIALLGSVVLLFILQIVF